MLSRDSIIWTVYHFIGRIVLLFSAVSSPKCAYIVGDYVNYRCYNTYVHANNEVILGYPVGSCNQDTTNLFRDPRNRPSPLHNFKSSYMCIQITTQIRDLLRAKHVSLKYTDNYRIVCTTKRSDASLSH